MIQAEKWRITLIQALLKINDTIEYIKWGFAKEPKSENFQWKKSTF